MQEPFLGNPSLKPIIQYLHNCFRFDNRELKIVDFFNKTKVSQAFIFEDREELLNGEFPKVGLEDEFAQSILKEISLFKKEKELLYCSLFLIGRQKSLGKIKRVCAPLILLPAEIVFENDLYFVKVDNERGRINTSALGLLAALDDNINVSELLAYEPSFPMGFTEVQRMGRALKEKFPQVDTEELYFFPDFWPERKLKRNLQPKSLKNQGGFKIVPASGLGVVSKSPETYGILADLEELEKSSDYSHPIIHALGDKVREGSSEQKEPISVPAVLNQAQEKAIQNARSQTLSMVVGPPGTGKSYTIACIALDHMLRGQSVLISSQQDEAVNVVSDKILQLIGTEKVFVRAGSKRNLQKMRKHLRACLNLNLSNEIDEVDFSNRLKQVEDDLKKAESRLEDLMVKELNWVEDLLSQSFTTKLRKWFLKIQHQFLPSHWKLMYSIHTLTEQKVETSKQYILQKHSQKLHEALARKRAVFQNLYNALKMKSSGSREEILKEIDFETLLMAFPIWMSKLSEIYRAIPLKKELFDLVIIDEASQCDMATSLAAMQRGKRVVVCGDPNQLRHLSFLSSLRMRQIAENFEDKSLSERLNFRSKSFLDLIGDQLISQNQVSFLEEHYRSHPEIAQFSNDNFYNGALRVMTERPIKSDGHGLHLKPLKGKRTNGVNEVEAKAILEEVSQIIQSELDFTPDAKSSIGIISPFRDQVDHIAKEIASSFDLKVMDDHNLGMGTPHSFQGEERDIILLSFAVDDDSHHGSILYLEKEDVFNVAITRAKSRQILFYSISPSQLPVDSLLRRYLNSAQKNRPAPESMMNQKNHDQFMDEVLDYLKSQECRFWVYYSVAGIPIDILVESKVGLKGIDLIGYPGRYSDALSVQRFKILARAKLPIFPLPYTSWLFSREESTAEINTFLEKTF